MSGSDGAQTSRFDSCGSMGLRLRVHRAFYGSPLLRILGGFLLGVLVGPTLRGQLLTCDMTSTQHGDQDGTLADANAIFSAPQPEPSNKERQLLLVGVMTAQKYVSTRVVATYRAWAGNIPGKVLFFSSEGTTLPEHPEIPIVALPGVDDSYPPQKKSFLMLKYMHDRYGNDFEWFMRADDDAFIKGRELSRFLRGLNSSVPQFLGQAGQGTKEELGSLSLEHSDNFCMGGPGMVLSRATLARMSRHIGYCLKHLYSTHEDVEIGRCVRKFAGVSCTWAFEMQNLFFQNYLDPNGSFANPQTMEMRRALTLHPIKNSTYQYHVRKYLDEQRIEDLRHRTLLLRRDIHLMRQLMDERDPVDKLGLPPSLNKFRPSKREEVLTWEFLTGKKVLSHVHMNPERGFEGPFKPALSSILSQVMAIINRNARQRGRTIDFNEVLYGYRRVNPLYGADYILDLLLIYRKHKGHKMTVPVRRHAYLQQTFTEPHFRELSSSHNISSSHSTWAKDSSFKDSSFFKQVQDHIGWLYKPQEESPAVYARPEPVKVKVIHFILPLSGRFQTFLHFMHNFEEVCLKRDEPVSLVVSLFRSETDDRTEDTVAYIETIQNRYPHHSLRVLRLEGLFSRGVGLSQGARLAPSEALLFFVDVDIYLNHDALRRLRYNAILGKQVFFPIVFSQYDPTTFCTAENECPQRSSPFQFAEDYGYWRSFGFGIAALHRADFDAVGGFDTSIAGWGKEDVDLYERFLRRNITIHRAAEPGLVHIFHPVTCDSGLEQAQFQMCLGSQLATYGSGARLANIVYNTPEILDENEAGDLDENEAADAAQAA